VTFSWSTDPAVTFKRLFDAAEKERERNLPPTPIVMTVEAYMNYKKAIWFLILRHRERDKQRRRRCRIQKRGY
jgi:hypothetical protein